MLKKVKYPVTVEEVADTIIDCTDGWDSSTYIFHNKAFGDGWNRISYNLRVVIDNKKNIYIGNYDNDDPELNIVEYEEEFSNELNLDCLPSYEKGPDNSPDDYECKEDWWNSYEYAHWLATWQDELCLNVEDITNIYFKDMCEWFASHINKAFKNHFKEAE